ncbi:MAG: cation diffusion facilitator family transporter [Haloferacaceae archaeon]
MKGSNTSVVVAALLANAAIAGLKFLGFLVTGSASMLSETYHSLSDTGNQVFLLVGIRYGRREATPAHPFGYGKAQFFFSFLVTVLLFGIAGWASAREGYHALVAAESGAPGVVERVHVLGTTFPGVYVNYAVLVGAVVFEGSALRKSVVRLRSLADQRGWESFGQTLRETTDVTTLTAFTEDSVAVIGALLALVGVALTEATGNPVYDALAALFIGLSLMGSALVLGWEILHFLLGQSVPPERESRFRAELEGMAGVRDVFDFRTVYFGPESILVTADVAFDHDLTTGEVDRRIDDIEARLQELESDVDRVYIEPELSTEDSDIVETT